MTKIFSVKFWTIFISTCCIGTGIILACADGWGEEFGISNFSPEVFVDSAYSPFFFSSQFYYGIGHEEQQDQRFNNSNLTEWATYFKNQINREELQYLLEKASTGAIDSAIAYTSGKTVTVPASMASFNTLKQKNDKNLSSFMAYLRLAKKSESFALNNVTGSWEYEEKNKVKKAFNAVPLNQQLLDAFTKTTDVFLKERYWFQLVRSYFFTTAPQQAIDCFTGNEKNMPHTVMYFRAMGYAAGALYKLKKFSKANYFYSRVYEGCNEMKTAAHYSFHPQEEKDWNATLALCSSNEEKITLWQMLGVFYADEQRAINEIYKLNPASDKLDLLLARSVNQYEQRFVSTDGLYIDAAPFDTIALRRLPALVSKIALAGNTGKPWVWQMAAGYIKTLDKKYTEANSWFSKAEKTMPQTKLAQAQLRLLKMINTIAEAKKIDSKLETGILADIGWLNNFDPKELPQLRYRDAFNWLKTRMAATYSQQKDLVKAECFTSSSIFYADNKNLEAMKNFLAKSNKSPYEKLCAELSAKKITDLFEFQAIRLAYADSIDEAIEKMQQAGDCASVVLPGNPFNGRIQDCHDCDHEAAQKIKYTRLEFLLKLKDIKSKIASGQDVYTNAVLLANAHYNISHFGNARVFYEGKVLGESHSDPYFIDSAFRKMLTGTTMATKYYTVAFKSAATDEQKARCQYMLSKCERNQWYNEHVYNKKDGYTEQVLVNFKAMNGFKAMKQYANTQYYKDVIKECGYFRSYIKNGR